MFNLNI